MAAALGAGGHAPENRRNAQAKYFGKRELESPYQWERTQS
jgi:hypothetical protein